MKHSRSRMYRREFLGTTARLGAGLGASAVAGNLLSAPVAATGRTEADSKTRPRATADTCIFVWLAGGMCHVDTFDPKLKGNGQEIAGSYYNPIETSVPGIQVCKHLPRVAERMDRFAIVRSLNHQFAEHTQAVDFVHTGRVASGTIVYPSIGSIVSHQLGGFDPKAPAYVVVGNPMQPRGPGFLGGKYNFVYLTDTEAGPSALRLPDGVSAQQYEEWTRTLKSFSEPYLDKHAGTPTVQAYASVMDRGFEMMSPKFQSAFSVKEEPAELRESYGKEFGQRLLLSRRLVENGIRFVECSFNLHFINGYGWDAHAFAPEAGPPVDPATRPRLVGAGGRSGTARPAGPDVGGGGDGIRPPAGIRRAGRERTPVRRLLNRAVRRRGPGRTGHRGHRRTGPGDRGAPGLHPRPACHDPSGVGDRSRRASHDSRPAARSPSPISAGRWKSCSAEKSNADAWGRTCSATSHRLVVESRTRLYLASELRKIVFLDEVVREGVHNLVKAALWGERDWLPSDGHRHHDVEP